MGDAISMIKDADNLSFYGTADTVLSIIANVMLVALYLSPMPTFWRMFRKESTEEFQIYPYVLVLANSGLWMLYGFSVGRPQKTPFYGACLALSNQIGFGLSSCYVAIFLFLTNKMNMIFTVAIAILVTLPMLVILVCVAMMAWHRLLGATCVVYGIIMYASPLFAIGTVYQTKSVEYLPFWLCMACFLNGVVWVIYTCVSPAPFDLYIAITNSVGMLLGIFQLLVYYKFHVNRRTVYPEGIDAI